MNALRAGLLGLAMLAGIAGAAPAQASTEGKTSLYEVIGRDPYRTSWKKMIAPVVAAHRWLKGAHGLWVPAQIVPVDAQRFKVFFLCKVDDCAGARITVVFANEGHHAYGALHTATGTQMLGTPNDSTKRALLKALHSSAFDEPKGE